MEGFRFGPEETGADEDAWQIWQANYLDADSGLAHTEASKCGMAYLLVLPGDDPETPRITVEHPAQAITYCRAGQPAAAAGRIQALAGGRRLGLGGALHLAPTSTGCPRPKNGSTWSSVGAIPNPIGAVPLIPMPNLPNLLGGGMSDLQAVTPLQDAINKLLADMLVNSEFVAYPQRYATGIEIPTDPATGRPMDREAFLLVCPGSGWPRTPR